jgi:uncharacterized protein with GYD domain
MARADFLTYANATSYSQRFHVDRGGAPMPKYLVQASYTTEGTKGLLKEGGTKRRAVVEQMVGGLGGKLEAFYYGFGETDAIVIVDAPDNVAAAAVSLAVNASGAVSLKTTPLLTPEEIDQACRKSVAYRAPGQ